MEKPDYTEQVLTYCIVIAIASFAGVVKAIRKYQKVGNSMSIKTLLFKALFDIVMAIFAGLMMFLWLQGEVYTPLTPKAAFYISIASYMGGQAIDIFVTIWKTIHDKSKVVE